MEKGLTKRQSEILYFIREFIRLNNLPPTINDICLEFGFSSSNSVHQQLSALERKGFLKRLRKGASRGMIPVEVNPIVPEARGEVQNIRRVQIVGEGSSLNPMDLFLNSRMSINIDMDYFRKAENIFGVIMPDESMAGEHIMKGDVILFGMAEEYSPGDIIAAMFNDILIVRKYQINGGYIELMASSRGYPKMKFTPGEPSLTVLGKFAGLFRTR